MELICLNLGWAKVFRHAAKWFSKTLNNLSLVVYANLNFGNILGAWKTLPTMSIQGSGIGVTATEDCVYAVGGVNGTLYHNTVEIFEARMERWRSGPKLNVRRS